jgi:dUTPase
LMLAPVFRADLALHAELDATSRQDGGFGHTGR